MSRGYGRTQREVLMILDQAKFELVGNRCWHTLIELARVLYGTDAPTRAQTETVRRSVKRLAAEGVIETVDGHAPQTYTKTWQHWSHNTAGRYVPDYMQTDIHTRRGRALLARRWLTANEQAEIDAEDAAWEAGREARMARLVAAMS